MSQRQKFLAQSVAELLATMNTHATMDEACKEVGIAGGAPEVGSKRERGEAAVAGLTGKRLAAVAVKVAIRYGKFDLEEAALIELEADAPPISEITRRDIARLLNDVRISGDQLLLEFLARIWPPALLDTEWGYGREIDRHMLRNDDWTTEDLFEHLGAFRCSLRRFTGLIDAALDPVVRRGDEQERLRQGIDALLQRDGYRIEEAGRVSGHPKYRVVKIARGVQGKPKNLIFASAGPKPEIGFKDAINNDVVILSNEESCLVYDRPIPDEGLLWSDLVAWWRETRCPEGTDDKAIRNALGDRLKESMRGASDAERNVFACYFRAFLPKLGAALPALIPQVYLHYDPATLKQLRNGKRLPRQRMDFLLLLPHRTRVVIEVDGAQHFADPGGAASLAAYADMARADRDLRLLGYEVYRFGANELVGEAAADVVEAFFDRLFGKHGIG